MVPRQSGFGSTSAGHDTLNPTNGGADLISLKKGWSRRIENSGLLRIPVKRDRRLRHCSGLKSISGDELGSDHGERLKIKDVYDK